MFFKSSCWCIVGICAIWLCKVKIVGRGSLIEAEDEIGEYK